ncbi:small glutamine-rich tetratricopeptide repeat-containing protein beta [Grus japonensis]|uniref:Small glutamine-rich tetratricopeptide repeat-containing protein beta n=1 Tax=Grus japonensis TaxID=30415 RepID=A0ABC9Y127_GRUJA
MRSYLVGLTGVETVFVAKFAASRTTQEKPIDFKMSSVKRLVYAVIHFLREQSQMDAFTPDEQESLEVNEGSERAALVGTWPPARVNPPQKVYLITCLRAALANVYMKLVEKILELCSTEDAELGSSIAQVLLPGVGVCVSLGCTAVK